ncbi:lost PHDs of trr isoform X2 [Haematobia irritans]|uniref:lost PHDs of trr isoform X2 n=1 Tax=Haematobia irritans TaxID=7368 RepID=UPI003F504DC9
MSTMEESSSRSSSTNIATVDLDPPYFTSKYPGKACCLCNLTERSNLGQGAMLKIPVNVDIIKSFMESVQNAESSSDDGLVKKKPMPKSVTINNEIINELDIIGHEEIQTLENAFTSEECFLYVHTMCGMWCMQLKRIEEDFVPNFEEVVTKSLQRKCSFCTRYGASINCRMSCQNNYHLPCAAASGCFLIIESFQAFCVEHLNQVPYIAVDTNIECRQCFTLGDISKLLMCSTCGAHYHNYCVGLANFPDSRSGWNCQQCCKCLICRQADNGENRSVKCEQCQKLYHTNCLRPIISSVPKYGWKCNRCRICTDCGSRTPGGGSSSRWHCHYTICDSCYQQRNKGFYCPICHKAYRSAAHKEMVKCNKCNRFVHSTCDAEADLSAYHIKKETNPDYDYLCPPCKSGKHLVGFGATDPLSIDGFPRELEAEFFDKDNVDISNAVDPLKISKKRMNLKDFGRGGKVGKLSLGKGSIFNQINRKRSVRGKGRPLSMLNSSSVQSLGNTDSNNTLGSEDDMSEKKTILCSAKDKFILMQDVCVMCGALGSHQEACLISCAQCGQCYHPYCANITVSKTMLQKGWRCLDCTICEGCGQKNDEARLILCDECDISYHIYCMSPPLDAVPNGNWKCNLCALCQKCGRSSPGKNSQWLNGFLECGPCASQSKCFVCSQSYNENELIIQCNSCERWLHGACDGIKNEEDAKQFTEDEYQCKVCRKDNNQNQTKATNNKITMPENSQTPSKQSSSSTSALEISSTSVAATTNTVAQSETVETTDNTFCIDGVCVSEHGFNMIRNLTTEIKKKRKLKSDLNQKDSSVMSSIDSVVAGNVGEGNTPIEGNTTPTFKDGMVWFGEDGSQPEGFSISTNEEGVNILRKKRQRNLQKLGIGGFNVRIRGVRKENEDIYMGTLENPSLTDEKKKKIIKKKLKSKLSESYPAYLQEAFFGKTLLENKTTVSFDESESSDEACINSQTQSSIVQQPIHTQSRIIKTESAQQPLMQNPGETRSSLDNEKLDPNLQNVQNTLMSSNNSNTNEKQISLAQDNSTNNQILASDNCILTSNANLGINQIKMDINQCSNIPVQNTIGNNLQTNKNQLVQQNFIQNSLNVNSNCQKIQQPQHMMTYQTYDQMSMTHKNPAQYLTQKSEDPMLSQVKIERDILLSQVVNTNECASTEASVEIPIPMEEPAKEPAVAGTQKTAEKMRKDEDLGEMATISAVLYANTQHPELKTLYPNWNERCKQILKKWRSLSTEMKAPFLQQAKDNRSVLRLRRTQQEPEKIYFQQKSLKEQEQERVWKQHQAKNKETYAFVGGDVMRPETMTALNQGQLQQLQQQHPQQQSIFDLNVLNDPSKNKVPKPVIHTTEPMNAINPLSQLNQQTQQQQQPNFMVSLNQQIHQASLDDLSKSYDPTKPSDVASQICERNDIFLSDKNWGGVAKLSDPKDTINNVAEKLETDENAGFGDILGGFGEGDDDDILKSLTAEIGDDFNILEYADPELDEINGSQNLLNKLDFDENQKPI